MQEPGHMTAQDAAGAHQHAEEELIHLPPNVVVPCPLTHPRATRMDKCPACPHWRGVVDRFDDTSKQPFAVRYLLRCAAPRSLTMTEFEP